MRFRSGHPAALLAAALASLALLSGCGSSGPTDRQQIAAIVKREGVTPASLCDHLTPSLLARVGGRGACLRQAATAAPDPTTHATAVRIDRNTATAVVVDRAGARTISFVKQRGAWKIAGVS